MITYIIRRLLQGAITIFVISIVTFLLMHLSPGGPIDAMLGDRAVSQEQIDNLRARWGLDDPLHQQYFTWLGNMARGNFGESMMRPGQTIGEMIWQAAPPTIYINVFAILISVLIALPIGVIAGIKRYSTFDYGSMLGATLGVCVPNFWLALMLAILFGVYLGILPISGITSWQGYILPVAVLMTEQTALLARLMRASTLEVLAQDYVTVARAKGLAERFVIMRHAVRNALLPVTTVIGYRIAFLLSGTVVVETIFAIPGLGRLFITSVYRSDYQVVQAIVLLFAVLVVVANILTDLLYAYIDPRIRV
jgi:ABC-type dipeptide/oligopeptide/nickel transport system permease component